MSQLGGPLPEIEEDEEKRELFSRPFDYLDKNHPWVGKATNATIKFLQNISDDPASEWNRERYSKFFKEDPQKIEQINKALDKGEHDPLGQIFGQGIEIARHIPTVAGFQPIDKRAAITALIATPIARRVKPAHLGIHVGKWQPGLPPLSSSKSTVARSLINVTEGQSIFSTPIKVKGFTPKAAISDFTYGGYLKKYPFLAKGVQSTVANTDLTNIKPGQPYAMASVLGVDGDVSKNLGLDFSSDPLTKSVQPVSEILPPEWIRKAGGVGLPDPDRAVAVQKLITQKIHTAMEAGPKFVREMFEEIWPHVDASELTTQQMKKKLTKALGSATKAKGPVDTSNLDRGLAEILVGKPKFLDEIGIIEDVVNNPNVLEPKNISKWLGGIDSRVSSTKHGIALHHTSLTSSKPVLDNATAQWGERFLNLMREKITPGAEGIVKQDALAHKPFSSPKIKNKSGKLVNDNTKWVVKGVLFDFLKKYTNLPTSKAGGILVNKELGKIGNFSPGLEGQLQKVIRSINDKAAHANWSHGTTGWTLDSRLAQYSPEDAFSVAEYIFDLERTVSMQGIRVTQILNKWNKDVSKGKFGKTPNLEKAVADLQRKIDNIRIDKSRIRAMEEAYQTRLDILLKEGPEALREFNTKALQGPRPAPDPVKTKHKLSINQSSALAEAPAKAVPVEVMEAGRPGTVNTTELRKRLEAEIIAEEARRDVIRKASKSDTGRPLTRVDDEGVVPRTSPTYNTWNIGDRD